MRAWLRQWFRPRPPGKTCAGCVYFENEPRKMERESPGLGSLGSGYGAVRGGDGQCARHRRYVTPLATCPDHQPRT